jgi:hypothetical protein
MELDTAALEWQNRLFGLSEGVRDAFFVWL